MRFPGAKTPLTFDQRGVRGGASKRDLSRGLNKNITQVYPQLSLVCILRNPVSWLAQPGI